MDPLFCRQRCILPAAIALHTTTVTWQNVELPMLSRRAWVSRSSTLPFSNILAQTSRPVARGQLLRIPLRALSYSRPTMAANGSTQALQTDKIEQEAHHLSNGTDTKVNNWATPGPAAFDFRSMARLSRNGLLDMNTLLIALIQSRRCSHHSDSAHARRRSFHDPPGRRLPR